jgi:uncharacterized protein YbjT (DUF2867 family)
MSILLIGASGRTGLLIAEKFYAAAMPFRPMIRSVTKSEAFTRLGATPVIGDLSVDVSQAFDGVDTVVYAAGSAETEGEDQERLVDRDGVIKSVDYAKRLAIKRFVVVSALLAYEPDRAPEALRHYSQMKRESDDYVIASGLDYLVLRPGALNMEPGVGTIQLVSDASSPRQPVARADVAEVVVKALALGVSNKVIGFAGGQVPISDALASV